MLGISEGSEGSGGSGGSDGSRSDRPERSEGGGELLQLRPLLDQESVLTEVVV